MDHDQRGADEAEPREVPDALGVMQATVAALEGRVAELERANAEPSRPVTEPPAGDRAGPTLSPTRRALVTRGAAAAAGAVVGGAVLAASSSTPAQAASGSFDGNPAVYGVGTPTNGIAVGVQGTIPSGGSAVFGQATATTGNGEGVRGFSASPGGAGVVGICDGVGVVGISSSSTNNGTGVLASTASPNGVAVQANGDKGVAVVASSSRTQLRLQGGAAVPTVPGPVRANGELVFDTNGDLWFCVAGGAPGAWRRLSGPTAAGALVPLTPPVRVYDSRSAFPPATGPKSQLAAGVARTVDVTLNASGVPTGATSALLSLVATGSAAAGFLSVYANGISWPGTSNLNFNAGQSVAVTTFTALDASGRCAVRANVACDVIVDVLGYFR